MAEILLTLDGPVATVTLSNPARHNAMTLGMWTALGDTLQRLHDDTAVRVVVLRGDGDKAFVSGADISEFGAQRDTPAAAQAYEAAVTRAQGGITGLRCPVIAAIGGICYGGGLGLALACDLRYATPGSRFRMPAARLGLGYALSGIRRMVDVLGPARSAELFYTARVASAAEAAAMGLLNGVHDDVFAHVQALAQEIAANAPLTVAAGKLAFNAALAGADAAREAAVDAAVQACFSSHDYPEGRAAFAAKRPPRFDGR